MIVDPPGRLRRAMQQLFRRFGALATDRTPCGQPLSMAHAHALMVLAARGDVTQQALGAELGIDKSNVARLGARLVAAGHATQRPGATDRRWRVLALTPRGHRLAAQLDVASRARFTALLAAIPAARRDAVIDGLQLLVAALAPPPLEERSPDDSLARPRPARARRARVRQGSRADASRRAARRPGR